VTAKQPAVKKYKLSADERERLAALIQKGKAPARQVLKARILLKADASEAGEPGATARLLRRWIPASTPSRARASNWSRVGTHGLNHVA